MNKGGVLDTLRKLIAARRAATIRGIARHRDALLSLPLISSLNDRIRFWVSSENRDNLYTMYNDAYHWIAGTEVTEVQERARYLESKLNYNRKDMKEAREQLDNVVERLRNITSELERTGRGDVKAIHLRQLEYETIQEELRLNRTVQKAEYEERETFALLMSAVRESHETERNYNQRIKMISLIGAIVGPCVGYLFSARLNALRFRRMEDIIDSKLQLLSVSTVNAVKEIHGIPVEEAEVHEEQRSILEDVKQYLGSTYSVLQSSYNTTYSYINDLIASLQQDSTSPVDGFVPSPGVTPSPSPVIPISTGTQTHGRSVENPDTDVIRDTSTGIPTRMISDIREELRSVRETQEVMLSRIDRNHTSGSGSTVSGVTQVPSNSNGNDLENLINGSLLPCYTRIISSLDKLSEGIDELRSTPPMVELPPSLTTDNDTRLILEGILRHLHHQGQGHMTATSSSGHVTSVDHVMPLLHALQTDVVAATLTSDEIVQKCDQILEGITALAVPLPSSDPSGSTTGGVVEAKLNLLSEMISELRTLTQGLSTAQHEHVINNTLDRISREIDKATSRIISELRESESKSMAGIGRTNGKIQKLICAIEKEGNGIGELILGEEEEERDLGRERAKEEKEGGVITDGGMGAVYSSFVVISTILAGIGNK